MQSVILWLERFVSSNYPTQFILLLAFLLVGWQGLLRVKSRIEAHRSVRLERVNFLVFTWFAATAGSLIYSLVTSSWPSIIWAAGFIAWNLAGLTILTVIRGSRAIRMISAVPILVALIITPAYDLRMDNFLAEIDRVLLCGPAVPMIRCPAAATTADIQAERPPKAESETNRTDVRVKPSSIAKGGYFFLTIFLVLSYYGHAYRAWHEDRLRTGVLSALDIGVIDHLVTVASLSASFILALFFAGADLPSLGIFSGLVAAGVSIALRDLLQNSVAGMLLLWDKTIKRNDVISVGGNLYGWVDSITLRYTLIKDRNDIHTLVPNSVLISGIVQNWTQTRDEVRLKVDISVAYGADLDDALSRLVQAARRVKRVLRSPAPNALVIQTGESAVDLQLRFWINDPREGIRNVISQVYLEILEQFAVEPKINIPFPQREIRLLGDDSASAPKATDIGGGQPDYTGTPDAPRTATTSKPKTKSKPQTRRKRSLTE